jgi:hypothetical protein
VNLSDLTGAELAYRARRHPRITHDGATWTSPDGLYGIIPGGASVTVCASRGCQGN